MPDIAPEMANEQIGVVCDRKTYEVRAYRAVS